MSKHKARIHILDNPEKWFTSPNRAASLVEQGLALWVAVGFSIRMRDPLAIRRERRVLRDLRDDAQYWRDVESQRGGAVAYEMRVVPTRPAMPGGPNGLSTLAFFPCVQQPAI